MLNTNYLYPENLNALRDWGHSNAKSELSCSPWISFEKLAAEVDKAYLVRALLDLVARATGALSAGTRTAE